jgi:hypothetical protein
MRKIKFRAWDKEKNKFVFDFYISLDGEFIEYDNLTIRKNIVLMQFTGLKDKNGKEIYEGDIVKMPEPSNEIIEIKWIEKLSGFSPICGLNYDFISHFPVPGSYLEVIGNIYENPDLSTPAIKN